MVHDHDTWADMKKRGYRRPLGGFKPIHMPKNTGAGLIISAFATICGFALVWYVWWLAALSFAAVIVTAIAHTFNYDRDFHIPAETVLREESARTEQLARA
jgi:cytochrome o ubiquinol oxidase subunit 1